MLTECQKTTVTDVVFDVPRMWMWMFASNYLIEGYQELGDGVVPLQCLYIPIAVHIPYQQQLLCLKGCYFKRGDKIMKL